MYLSFQDIGGGVFLWVDLPLSKKIMKTQEEIGILFFTSTFTRHIVPTICGEVTTP